MGVAAEIRHKTILEKLNASGRIYVPDLAKEMKITEVTIRRDLAFLHKYVFCRGNPINVIKFLRR